MSVCGDIFNLNQESAMNYGIPSNQQIQNEFIKIWKS